MKKQILTMLREKEEYVSGQQICETLGVSRTAVWKCICALKEDGYRIDSQKNRGYHLEAAPDVLTEAEIGSRRRDLWKNAPLLVFQETDSTNIQANRLAEEGAPEGTLVVADRQNGGKGRRGRSWETPSGTALAMSFVLRPAFRPEKASMLTLLAAMAGKKAVEDLAGSAPQIKWPNDLLLSSRKIAGILTEMKLEEQDIRQIVVGIGFNVSQESFEGELSGRAASIFQATGRRISRAELCCRFMEHFGEEYLKFREEQNLAFLREEYNASLVSLGEEVRILEPSGDWTGICRGIDAGGALLVEAGGSLHKVISGEVSVRGVNGYV